METIIDCHVHVYPEKIADKASASIGKFYDMPMRFDGRVNTIISKCKENGVSKCVINSVATTPEQVKSINNFIAQTVKENGDMFCGLCTLHQDMSRAEIESELERIIELGLRGIKLHPDFQRFEIDSREAYKIYETAENRLPILFHTGDSRFNFSSPRRLAKVVGDFPKLVAIGAHFGGWSEWDDGVKYLAGKENVYVDTSSSFYAMTEEKALETIKAFGAERVLFGTDFPMWDVGEELKFFDKLDLSGAEREKILSGNITKLLNL